MTAKNAYETLFHERLAAGSHAFISVNFEIRTVLRTLSNERPKRDERRVLTDLYLRALRSDLRFVTETHRTFWNEFFLRLNARVLGTTRSKKGDSLVVLGYFENPGNKLDRNSTDLHLHCYVQVPVDRTFDDVKNRFLECWERFVMPIPSSTHVLANKGIDIVPWVRQGNDGYVSKQVEDFELASERLFAPDLSRKKRRKNA
jgi:hypothetical protein